MQENFKQNADKFHLIGHGIGAHGAGEVGSKIPGLARITGDLYENMFFLKNKKTKQTMIKMCISPPNVQYMDNLMSNLTTITIHLR